MLKTIIICLCALYGFLYFLFAILTQKPFKTIFTFAFLGISALALIDLTARFSGVYIPINSYTLGTSAALGLPGTIGLLVLRVIFM